jgi:hypothetical protein
MDLTTALAFLASAFFDTAVVLTNVGLRYLDPARVPSIPAMRGMPSRDLCAPVGED